MLKTENIKKKNEKLVNEFHNQQMFDGYEFVPSTATMKSCKLIEVKFGIFRTEFPSI